MKIILDTNCLLVSLPRQSPYRFVWDAFCQGKFYLCYSTEILKEYEEVLLRYHSTVTVSLIMETLLNSPNAIPTVPYYKWNLISTDPDDNKFVDCAINAGVDFIVSNDKHFKILKTIDFPKVNVVDINLFKEIICMY
jgi:putative PIN family toxin of toxin-antitoxin system